MQEWTFGNLKRGADHRFGDDDLANILHNATEARAGAFKARGIPEALRIIEVMGIEQSRSWGACSVRLVFDARMCEVQGLIYGLILVERV